MPRRCTDAECVRWAAVVLPLLTACDLIPASDDTLVPIYALDERDLGGRLHISVREMDLQGKGQYGRKQSVHYVSAEIARRLAKDPQLFDAYVKRQRR